MNVSVGTMVDLRFESRSFDYVFVPGCLCYLRTLDQVGTFFRLLDQHLS